MKIVNSLKFLAVIVLLSAINGCTGKANQLAGKWVMEWNFVNGHGQDDGSAMTWTFFKDNTFIQSKEFANEREELKGNWNFDKNSNELIMFYTATQMEVKWQVVKLERESMEVNHTTRGFFVERKFLKQP